MSSQNPTFRFAFKPVEATDRALLMNWLSQPDTREWWGDPDEELRLIFQGEASGVSRGFIAHLDGERFAYIQCWEAARIPQKTWAIEPWVAGLPAATQGVDITIGIPTLLGKGQGSACVRAFSDMLFEEGAPFLVIDPDARNLRAVRAYQKAGFRRFASHTQANGETTILLSRDAMEHGS